jgi:hypothetical protein
MTKEKAEALFNKVGGVDEINKEGRALFDHYGTNVSTVIYVISLTNFPAISLLARSVFLQTNPGWSAHIGIPFGSHCEMNFIFVFDSRNPIEFPFASNCIEMTTNIFARK